MAILKPFVAYNGTQCDYHALISFEHGIGDVCVAKMSSHATLLDAKLRRGEVVVRQYPLTGIARSEAIRHDIYQKIVLLPDFEGGVQV
jgi:hypothetical protein